MSISNIKLKQLKIEENRSRSSIVALDDSIDLGVSGSKVPPVETPKPLRNPKILRRPNMVVNQSYATEQTEEASPVTEIRSHPQDNFSGDVSSRNGKSSISVRLGDPRVKLPISRNSS